LKREYKVLFAEQFYTKRSFQAFSQLGRERAASHVLIEACAFDITAFSEPGDSAFAALVQRGRHHNEAQAIRRDLGFG
jgi:hypothetical protein